MAKITLTEALAEIKLIDGKLGKKAGNVLEHLTRPKVQVDPLEDKGGSPKFIAQEMQAIDDLGERLITIRQQISRVNQNNVIEVLGVTRTISNWLAWRRDVYPNLATFYNNLSRNISQGRRQLGFEHPARRAGQEVASEDMIVHIDEVELMGKIEHLDAINSKLDGLLSLKNAQIEIEVP